MKLFVGLGNPGSEYARQRHNVGFMAVERIAERHGLGPWKKRFHGLVCEGPIGGHSGHAAEAADLHERQRPLGRRGAALSQDLRKATSTSSTTSSTWRPAKLKVKTGGGNAGHNGLRSITAHIGNEYARVRIGIGHPGSKEQVLRHVLHDFAKADAVWLDPLLDAIADAAPRLAAGDDARFLTDVARAPRPARRRPRLPPPRRLPCARRSRPPRRAAIRPASARASAPARWPRTSSDG